VKTFEYRLRPNRKQAEALMEVLIASRKLYNAGLEELVTHFQETGSHLHRYEHDKQHGKAAHPDLPAVVVDTTLDRLHRSFGHFFRGLRGGRKVGFPRFKRENRWNTIQLRDCQHTLTGSYFHAPRQCGGDIRVNVHQPLEGRFKFGRLVLRPSGWYLQCVCETEPMPLPALDNAVGLDMRLTYLVADSTGKRIRNPKNLQRGQAKLAKAQQRFSRCRKGSRRCRKAARNVARQHERIANQRKDLLHKISRQYVDGFQTIAVEDLKPANMLRNHSLARAISDASWGRLRQMLASKAAEAGRQLVAVPPHYTSQECSACRARVEKSLSVRTHVCPHCGYVADRDVNAALNILKAAQAALARTGPSPTGREGLDGSIQ
jgi:putative transposase